MSVNQYLNGKLNLIAGAGGGVGDVLDTIEEINSNTQPEKIAGALAVKNLLGGVRFGTDGDGNYGYYKADDSFVPFKSGGLSYTDWILAGGLNPTEYETLDDLLEDEAAIRTLMTKKTAVDVLTNLSENDLRTIINHRYAAKWINYREYAYSKLSDSILTKALMDESGMYGMYITTEKKPKALIPTLTSNTGSDGGQVICSSYRDSYYPWRIFRGTYTTSDDGNYWQTTDGDTNRWIGYKFAVPTVVTSFDMRRIYATTPYRSWYTMCVEASNDGNQWLMIASDIAVNNNGPNALTSVRFKNDKAYLYWRVRGVTYTSDGTVLTSLQFYGYQLEKLIPTMTSNTYNGYTVTTSSTYSSDYPGWKVFDGTINATSSVGTWASSIGDANAWLQVKLPSRYIVRYMKITPYFSNHTYPVLSHFKLQGSNDESIWDDLLEGDVGSHPVNNGATITYNIDKNNSYSYYRLCELQPNSKISNGYVQISEIQLYGEPTLWQPKGLIPVMTSNTTPYGEAFTNSIYSTTNDAYKAFDDNLNSWWHSKQIYISANGAAYIGYKFTQPTKVSKFKISVDKDRVPSIFKLQGSNDGSVWDDLASYDSNSSNIAASSTKYFDINNDKYYISYRLYIADSNINPDSTAYASIKELQFYGRQLEALIPPMTSNTTPMGKVTSISQANTTNNPNWKVFDGNDSTLWYAAITSSATNIWVQYEFNEAIFAEMFGVKWGTRTSKIEYVIQGSNNSSDWEDLTETISNASNVCCASKSDKPYRCYRIYIKNQTMNGSTINCGDLATFQLYGAPDYESRTYIYDHGVELGCEDISSKNGWSIGSYTLQNPIHNDDNIVCASSGDSIYSGFSSSEMLNMSEYNVVKAYIEGVKISGSDYGAIGLVSGKTAENIAYTSITNGSPLFYLDVSSITSYGYVSIRSINSRQCKCHALWLE